MNSRVQITLNGEPRELEDGTTVASLVEALALRQPRFAIEINRQIVRRDSWPTTALQSGDQVEVISFVGGG